MHPDRYKDEIRDALREEVERLTANGDRKSVALLLAGARTSLVERQKGWPETKAPSGGYFELGRRLVAHIKV